MRVLFVRHGQSLSNVTPRYIAGASPESPLTATGRAQAMALGVWFKQQGARFNSVFSSTAVRASDTCRIVLEHSGAFPVDQVVFSDQIQEQCQGINEGKLRSQVYTPELLARNNAVEDGAAWYTFKAEGGESMKDVEERMVAFVQANLVEDPTHVSVFFSHGLAMRSMLRRILNRNPNTTFPRRMDNTALVELDWLPDGTVTLLRENDRPHADLIAQFAPEQPIALAAIDSAGNVIACNGVASADDKTVDDVTSNPRSEQCA